jgi:hypothetical protein
MAWNSASALDLATIDWFLLHQVTRFPPTRVQYPEVDLRFVIDPANLHMYNLVLLDDNVGQTTLYLVQTSNIKVFCKMLPYETPRV